MNKKQLVVKLSGALNLSKADAERTFDTITNTILDALNCLLYTSPSPRDLSTSRMPSSA